MAERDVVRLVDAQAAQIERVRTSLIAALVDLVLAWTDWYSPSEVRRFAERAIRLIEPAQSRAASTTDAYLARVIGEARGRAVAPIGVRIDPDRLRGGTEHAEVVERIAAEYRRHVADGLSEDEARRRAAQRATRIADDDVSLAIREASRQVYTRTPQITGYRRMIHPERSRGGSCGLCVLAADRVYRKAELMPLHSLCKCTTLPIVGSVDPGRSMNERELAEFYEAAGGTGKGKLARTRYSVHEHGELGPVLREVDDHFRDAGDVAEDVAA